MRTFSPYQLLSLIVTATLASCGGSDLILPADGSPASLRAVSGSGQQATVGTRLPDPLVVRLTDGAGRPVRGVTVDFRFQSDIPGAQFEPATRVMTNDTGYASVQVRLGTAPGDQTIEAAVGATPSAGLLATFGVTAVAPQGGGGGRPGKPGRGGGHDDDNDDD
jgi:hypothetical protein